MFICVNLCPQKMNFALNSALSHFKQENGELVIGNRSVSSLAHEFGTPLYIYDQSHIEQRCKTLRNLLPHNLKIYYAVKANPNIEILKIMHKLYDGFDIASKGEMEKGITAGIEPDIMSFTGPGKSVEELGFAVENNIGSLSIESEHEVEHLASICKSLNKTAKILVRINPAFELSQSGMKMGGGPKQFGIDSELAPALIKRIMADDRLRFEGIHIFAGSQNLNADQIILNFEKILEYACELSFSEAIKLKTVNMGGGFGIPYFSHEKELDIKIVGQRLAKLLSVYSPKLTGTTFKIELGRFLVGESGIYLSRVLYRKISRKKVFLITNGGMHHHLAASGNFGQSLVRRPMPITIANRLNFPTEKVNVVGPLCTPLDTFGEIEIPIAEVGDLVAVFNSGAYGLSASPVAFLSHNPPKEIII